MHKLITEEIPNRVAADKALARVMTAVLKDDTELFKQSMDNESFRRWTRWCVAPQPLGCDMQRRSMFRVQRRVGHLQGHESPVPSHEPRPRARCSGSPVGVGAFPAGSVTPSRCRARHTSYDDLGRKWAGEGNTSGTVARRWLPARAWERFVLPARVEKYDRSMLDLLCLYGEAGWARVTPAPAAVKGATPIAVFLREHARAWLTQYAEP